MYMEDKYFYDKKDKKVIALNGVTYDLYRIVANQNFTTALGDVKKGDKGGYISNGTLSQEGNCWVDGGSLIGPDCFVSGDACICKSILAHDVFVGNTAVVSNSRLNPETKVTAFGGSSINSSVIYGGANLSGEAKLFSCRIMGNVSMTDDAVLTHCNVVKGSDISFVGKQQAINFEIRGTGWYGISDSIQKTKLEKSLTL